MLNDKAIKAAGVGTHRAGDNLYLRVTPTGRKSFYLRFNRNKKSSWKLIGAYPGVTLAEARKQAAELIAALIVGGSAADDMLRTVSEAFEAYYAHLEKQYRRPEQMMYKLLKDVLPQIGKIQLQALTRSNCTAVLQTIVDRGSPVSANRTMEFMKRALSFFEDRGWIEANPMARIRRANIGGKEKPRSRNLSFDEISSFLTLLQGESIMPGVRWALYMILLTGLRSTEVLNLSDDGTVTSKMNRVHRIPLTPQVRAMLKVRPQLPGHHGVLAANVRRLKCTFTPHDLRRTFASRLSDIGVMPHVIEKMLDHQMEGVMAVYNRAEFWPERVAAQRLWGTKLSSLRREARPIPWDGVIKMEGEA